MHKPARTKITEEESEEPKEADMEVDDAVLPEASAEIQSPRRKVVRVESGETQDYVCETLATRQEEAVETGFLPSAHLLVRQSMQ